MLVRENSGHLLATWLSYDNSVRELATSASNDSYRAYQLLFKWRLELGPDVLAVFASNRSTDLDLDLSGAQ